MKKREEKSNRKAAKSSNPLLIEEMSKYFDRVGIYRSTSSQIREHLLTVIPQ